MQAMPGAMLISCMPDWSCGNWSRCFPQGFRIRECIDLKNCNTTIFRPNTTEPCSYTPTCFDGVKNQDEEGVDCGGVCKKGCGFLQTCYDNIRNNGEEGVDCGGPCPPCQKTESCFDGVKNQDEEGVDCGGVCGKKCPNKEMPARENMISWTRLLMVLLILFTVYAVSYYARTKRRQIYRFLKRIRKALQKRLIAKRDKTEILLERLGMLEKKLPKSTPEKSISVFGSIMNDYLSMLLKIRTVLTHEEKLHKISNSKLEHGLKELLKSFYNDISELEFSTKKLNNLLVLAFIYEARNLICYTTPPDAPPAPMPERKEEIKPLSGEDAQFKIIAEMNMHLLNNDAIRLKKAYGRLHDMISSKTIKNKYAISSIKRFQKLLSCKNAKKEKD